jgi:hypothetical protein
MYEAEVRAAASRPTVAQRATSEQDATRDKRLVDSFDTL